MTQPALAKLDRPRASDGARVLREAGRLGRPAPLPHRSWMERAFGTRLDDVRAYVGAGEALEAAGATTPDAVMFADERPAAEVVAHEVAHVMQNRVAGRAAGGLVADDNAPAEREARAVAPRAAAGEAVEVSAPPAGSVQFGWFRRRPRAKPALVLRDDHLLRRQQGKGGTKFSVDRMTYDEPIGTSGVAEAFFKPTIDEFERNQWSDVNAVQSRRMAQLLGFKDLLADEQFGFHTIDGEDVQGSISPMVPGMPLHKTRFRELATFADDQHRDSMLESAPMNYKKKIDKRDGQEKIFKVSGVKSYEHDFTRSRTQRDLADLQLLDAIVGQSDRHGGNIFLDPKTGRARGIDNDQSFDRMSDLTYTSTGGKYVGLPAQVDRRTAARVLRLKASDLPTLLAEGMPGTITGIQDPEMAALQARLEGVQSHVRTLKDQGLLVRRWNKKTYAAAVGAAPKTYSRAEEGTYYPSYLQTAVKQYENPGPGDFSVNGPASPAAPVVLAPVVPAPVVPAPVVPAPVVPAPVVPVPQGPPPARPWPKLRPIQDRGAAPTLPPWPKATAIQDRGASAPVRPWPKLRPIQDRGAPPAVPLWPKATAIQDRGAAPPARPWPKLRPIHDRGAAPPVPLWTRLTELETEQARRLGLVLTS